MILVNYNQIPCNLFTSSEKQTFVNYNSKRSYIPYTGCSLNATFFSKDLYKTYVHGSVAAIATFRCTYIDLRIIEYQEKKLIN